MMMSSPPPPSWPDQGGNIVIINGGASEDRIKEGGAPPPEFPDFSVPTFPGIVFGGWSGPPPGPPAGTGLVGGGGAGPEPGPLPPPVDPGEEESDYMLRCVPDLEGQGVETTEAESMCANAWAAAQEPGRAMPQAAAARAPTRRRRK